MFLLTILISNRVKTHLVQQGLPGCAEGCRSRSQQAAWTTVYSVFESNHHHCFQNLRSGFYRAVLQTLRCCPDALLCMGPPCSTYVFMSLGTSLRSETRPYGNEDLQSIELGSLFLSKSWMYQTYLFWMLGVYWTHSWTHLSVGSELRLCARALLLALLATVRGVHVVLEQPQSSTMKFHPDFKATANAISSMIGKSAWSSHFLLGPQNRCNVNDSF